MGLRYDLCEDVRFPQAAEVSKRTRGTPSVGKTWI